jgi:hypothetical protein
MRPRQVLERPRMLMVVAQVRRGRSPMDYVDPIAAVNVRHRARSSEGDLLWTERPNAEGRQRE